MQNAPFLAHDESSPPTGYYGSGMGVLSNGAAKLGPYVDAEARHQFEQSSFHAEREYCGTCHDVSNPVVGDLAHNFGIPAGAAPPSVDGTLGGALEDKAAFNNFPYQYGVVERTYSEFMSGSLPFTQVADFALLPLELQSGALEAGFNSATASGGSGDYADGTARYYTCQTCHMRPWWAPAATRRGFPPAPTCPCTT